MSDSPRNSNPTPPDAAPGPVSSRPLLETLMRHSPDSIYFKDLEGRFIMINDTMARRFGLERAEDAVGKTDFDFFAEEHAAQALEDERQVIRTGDPLIGIEEKETWPDGRVNWVSTSKLPLRDNQDRIVGTFGLSRDVTVQRRQRDQIKAYADELEKQLLDRSLLETLMHNLPDLIYFKDKEGRFIMINETMVRRFGLDSSAAAAGKTDFDFFAEEHAAQAFSDEQEVIRSGKPLIAKEEKETWPDGHISWVSTSKLPLRDEQDAVVGTFGLSRDVTENRRQREQIESYARELEAANRQTEADLALASEVQQCFLPQSYPVFPQGVAPDRSKIRFSHFYRPSGLVGGDLVSIMPVSETRAGVFVCDVMGHGVQSGFVTALLHALVMEMIPRGDDPGTLLTVINRRLLQLLSSLEDVIFATAFYLTLDADTGELAYSSAGHPTPFWLKRQMGRCVQLISDEESHGAALALADDSKYTSVAVQLNPGDRVMLFTDGLYEVEGDGLGFLGEDQLLRSVQNHLDAEFDEFLDAVFEEVRKYGGSDSLSDDVCIACVEWVGESSN